MKKYEMLSEQHYIDSQSGVVTTSAKLVSPCYILVPNYLYSSSMKSEQIVGFNMKNGQLVNEVNRLSPTNTLHLNGLILTFVDDFTLGIQFYDRNKKERHEVVLKSNFHKLSRKQSGKEVDFIVHNTLQAVFDGVEKVFDMPMNDAEMRERFKGVGFITNKTFETVGKSGRFNFAYGLPYRQLGIGYKNRLLDGTCYVFFYGAYGILLRDDLSLDALVIFDGYSLKTVHINRFLYTSNRYLIKTIMFSKED